MPHGQPLLPGKIYNANLAYLTGRLLQLDCNLTEGIVVGDDADKITAASRKCVEEADVILTTGGVSVGVKDLLPEIMKKLGADILFHGIDLKPGMPQWHLYMPGNQSFPCPGIPSLHLLYLSC